MRSFTIWLVMLGVLSLCVCPVPAQTRNNDDRSATPDFGAIPEVPAGQTARYLVTYMKSNTASTAFRTATVVSVTNQSAVSCSISVDWFAGVGTTIACTTNLAVSPGHTVDFCSRPIPDGVTTCNSTCSPAQTFLEGRARVASTADLNGACASIGVEGRVYYLTGTTTTDTGIVAVSNSNVVRVSQGNN